MTRRASQKGVTLVETLVALAVMGFVVGSLLVLIGQNSRFAAAMRDRTMASIAADNLMVEAMVLQEALQTGEQEGEVIVEGRTWTFHREIEETGIDDVLRISISVSDPETGQTIAHTTSMRRPE